MNDYINITPENLDTEHLCCAIGDPKHQQGIDIKKNWLKDRINEGHIFRKLNARGKVFIEYAPLELAWTPVSGKDYMYIYCLWVAGSFKGKGYAKELLTYAIEDAKKKNKNGICVISSNKKKPYLSEKAFFLKHGFKVVDSIGEFELLSLSFNNINPKFNDCARKFEIEDKTFTVYYSPECPFTSNCVKEIIEYSKQNNIKLNIEKIDTLEKAKSMPCVFNNWVNFYNGKFLSNLLLNKNSFEKLVKN